MELFIRMEEGKGSDKGKGQEETSRNSIIYWVNGTFLQVIYNNRNLIELLGKLCSQLLGLYLSRHSKLIWPSF